MALYKMNKFIFQLADDEAWRLDVPSIPELTKYADAYTEFPELPIVYTTDKVVYKLLSQRRMLPDGIYYFFSR